MSEKLKPVLNKDTFIIAPKPNLSSVLPDKTNEESYDEFLRDQVNDHCIFKDKYGGWHLWACVRNTRVGRMLYHWTADSLTQSPWKESGECIRAKRSAGESLVDWKGQEFLQSPFVIVHEGKWYMFYGGYATGVDPDGNPTTDYGAMENQISLMISDDGLKWERYDNGKGQSRLFAGPGAARDPFVMELDGRFYIYYTGHKDRNFREERIYLRESEDLFNWSEPRVCHYEDNIGDSKWRKKAESPFIYEKEGYFYLFKNGTKVFRSDDPRDFGIGDAALEKYVELPHGKADVVAPEIVIDDDGTEYISSIFDSDEGYGVWLRPLLWQS